MSCIKCSLGLCSILVDCENFSEIKTPFYNEKGNSFEYELELSFLGTVLSYKTTINDGDQIIFPNITLNEDYCYSFQVKDDIGYLEKDGANHFKFCTKPNKKV